MSESGQATPEQREHEPTQDSGSTHNAQDLGDKEAQVAHVFSSTLQLVLFTVTVLGGQSVNLIPFGASINCNQLIADYIGVGGNEGQTTWILAAYSTTAAAFVLVGGQLCDVLGPRNVWQAAMAWMLIFNLVAGFARGSVFFNLCRGLAGISCGVLLPAGITLLGRCYPPGKSRAIVFGLFGALAPFSAAGGSVFQSLLAQLVSPAWIWWSLAIMNGALLIVSFFGIPKEITAGSRGKIDYIGGFFGASGLVLLNFSIIRSIEVGWKQPSAFVTLVVGFALLVVFALLEKYVVKTPVLPFDIWKTPTFGWLLLSAFLGFLSFGVYVVYVGQFLLRIRMHSALLTQACFTPFTIGAFCAAILSGQATRVLNGKVIMLIGLLCLAIANVLLATCPPEGTYWTHTFFAMCFVAFGPDFIFTAAQLLASNSVARERQGVAGSLVGTALNFGLALGAGLGGIVDTQIASDHSPLEGIRSAFYLGIGFSGLGIILVILLVNVPVNRN